MALHDGLADPVQHHHHNNDTILLHIYSLSYWVHQNTLGVASDTWIGALDHLLYPFIGPSTFLVYFLVLMLFALGVYKIYLAMSYEELCNSYDIVMSFLSAGFAFCMLFINLTWLLGQVLGSVCDILNTK